MGPTDDIVARGARHLSARLGTPDMGVMLGSGFAPLAEAIGSASRVPAEEIPEYPRASTEGHEGGVSVAEGGGGRIWIFHGRLHLYEGLKIDQVVRPVEILAAAGARAVLLTCAAGGLLEVDRPGDFARVTDHVNLTGADPVAAIPARDRRPPFLDLQEAYDPRLNDIWRRRAADAGVRMRDGVLAAVAGPSYETPAEVRMLRTLGADLVSMSTVPEVIAARYRDLRVVAVVCIANRGAGVADAAAIRHAEVVGEVTSAVRQAATLFRDGVNGMLGATT